MPDILKMEEVFNKALEKFESAERRYLNHTSQNGAYHLSHEIEVIRQTSDALRKQFEEAKE